MINSAEQKEIKIGGMSCSGCANMIAENLSKLDGVQEVNVHLDNNSATVKYNSQRVTPDDFKAAVETTGYGFEGMK